MWQPIVVGVDEQQAVCSGAYRGPREYNTVPGVVAARSGNDGGAVADRVDHGAEDALLLLIAGGGGLSGGSVDDEAVVALLIDEVGREAGHPVVVHLPIVEHGGDHRGQHLAEGRVRRRTAYHVANGTAKAGQSAPTSPFGKVCGALRSARGRSVSRRPCRRTGSGASSRSPR